MLRLALIVGVAAREQCLSPEMLQNLGIKPTYRPNAKQVVLERNGWAGHYATTAVATILLEEALGFPTTIFDDPGGVNSYKHCADGTVDANMELWVDSNGVKYYDQWVTQAGLVADGGILGVIGRSGWYIPKNMIEEYSEKFPDFWRAYLREETLSLFPPSGSTPEALMVGNGKQFIPPWCVQETDVPQCAEWQLNTPAYFGPNASCVVSNYSSSCIELLGIDGYYDPGVLQQQVFNNGMNITIPFVSETNFYDLVRARLNARQAVLFYYWVPSIFIVQNNVSRVALKGSTDACLEGNTANWTGVGGVDCDFPPQNLIKIFDQRLTLPDHDDRFPMADAVRLFQQFSLHNSDQDEMMLKMSFDPTQWHNDSFAAACEWLQANQNRWSNWIQNTPAREESIASTGAQVVVVVVAALGLVWALFLVVFLARFRTSRVIKASSYIFCQLIVIGSLLGYLSVLVQPFSPLAVCSVYPALLSLSFSIAIGALLLKTVRLFFIFRNQLKKSKLSTRKLLTWLGVFVLYDFVVLAVWFGKFPMSLELESLDAVDIRGCSSESMQLFELALILPKAMMLLAGVWLAYRNRDLPQNFNESWYIAVAMYTIAILTVIIFPIAEVLRWSPSAHLLLTGLSVVVAYTVTTAVIFVPKMALIRNPPPTLPMVTVSSTSKTSQEIEDNLKRHLLSLTTQEAEEFLARLKLYREQNDAL